MNQVKAAVDRITRLEAGEHPSDVYATIPCWQVAKAQQDDLLILDRAYIASLANSLNVIDNSQVDTASMFEVVYTWPDGREEVLPYSCRIVPL